MTLIVIYQRHQRVQVKGYDCVAADQRRRADRNADRNTACILWASMYAVGISVEWRVYMYTASSMLLANSGMNPDPSPNPVTHMDRRSLHTDRSAAGGLDCAECRYRVSSRGHVCYGSRHRHQASGLWSAQPTHCRCQCDAPCAQRQHPSCHLHDC